MHFVFRFLRDPPLWQCTGSEFSTRGCNHRLSVPGTAKADCDGRLCGSWTGVGAHNSGLVAGRFPWTLPKHGRGLKVTDLAFAARVIPRGEGPRRPAWGPSRCY